MSVAVRKSLTLHHPESEDFSDQEVDCSPCGSGVTARIATQYKRNLIVKKQKRKFVNGKTKNEFTGMVVDTVTYGEYEAVVVEVAGEAYYTGTATFTVESKDPLRKGFLLQ